MPSLWKIGLGFLSVESTLLPFINQENEAIAKNFDSASVSVQVNSLLHRPDGVPHVDVFVVVNESGLVLNTGDMTFQSGRVHMNGTHIFVHVNIVWSIHCYIVREHQDGWKDIPPGGRTFNAGNEQVLVSALHTVRSRGIWASHD